MNKKRIRLWPTSKNGCLTCKERHVKCDEERPDCIRCVRAKRTCEGYERNAERETLWDESPNGNSYSSATGQYLPALKVNIRPRAWPESIQSEQQFRSVELGLHLLSHDSFSQPCGDEDFLIGSLPQLCFSDASLTRATAAVGAVYLLRVSLDTPLPREIATAAYHYQNALRAAQGALSSVSEHPVPIILMCLMISMVEVFLQRDENALFHLLAAAEILKNHWNIGRLSRVPEAGASENTTSLSRSALDALLRTLEFQATSYALGKCPQILPVVRIFNSSRFTDLKSSYRALVELIHACFRFMSDSYNLKYQSSPLDGNLRGCQDQLVALLRTWLKLFEDIILTPSTGHNSSTSISVTGSQACKLHMTALSTLIQVCCTLSPYETAYDAFVQEFNQIIESGERVLSFRDKQYGQFHGPGHQFTLGPGIIEPLLLTAFRFRHPIRRRRAIKLLRRAGCEGPWNGIREATITSQIMGYEEAGLSDVVKTRIENICNSPIQAQGLDHSDAQWLNCIPESARICDMGFSHDPDVFGRSKNVNVRYRQCPNIKQTIGILCEHRPACSRRQATSLRGLCRECGPWVSWTENIEWFI